MAVLVEAARETILDLARGHMSSTMGLGGGQEGLGGEVLRMLREQKGRLDRLELAAEKPKADWEEFEIEDDGEEQAPSEGSNSPSSDEHGDEQEEDEQTEHDQEVASDEGTSSSGRSSDRDDQANNDADDENDSD